MKVRWKIPTLVVFVVLANVNLCSGQIMLMDGLAGANHPAAIAGFGNPEVASEIVSRKTHEIHGPIYVDGPLPPDSLIDPDGRVVMYGHERRFDRERKLKEEAHLLAAVAESEGKKQVHWVTWIWSLAGCSLIVGCGVAPAFILPVGSGAALQTVEGHRKLNLLLSFAVGSLLGDVFLHLLPEVWAEYHVNMLSAGLWMVGGLLLCFLVEKCCATTEESQHRICAIMNLIANFTDNFTHGLAVGGSFLVGRKFGLLTTFAILIHEFPHEISDFAILLRADFDRWSAVRAQLFTSVGGILGACSALFMHTDLVLGDTAYWILPFTAGGFLNIALAQILPELMRETNPRQNILQLLMIVGGVGVMFVLNQFH